MVTQHCFLENLLVGKIVGGGPYSPWGFLRHRAKRDPLHVEMKENLVFLGGGHLFFVNQEEG